MLPFELGCTNLFCVVGYCCWRLVFQKYVVTVIVIWGSKTISGTFLSPSVTDFVYILWLTVCLGDVIRMIFHSTCGFLLLDSSAWIILLQNNSKSKLIQLENVLNKTNYELIFQDNTASDWPWNKDLSKDAYCCYILHVKIKNSTTTTTATVAQSWDHILICDNYKI